MPIVADFCRVRVQQWIKVIIAIMVIFLCSCFDRGSFLSLTKYMSVAVCLFAGLQWSILWPIRFRTSYYRLSMLLLTGRVGQFHVHDSFFKFCFQKWYELKFFIDNLEIEPTEI